MKPNLFQGLNVRSNGQTDFRSSAGIIITSSAIAAELDVSLLRCGIKCAFNAECTAVRFSPASNGLGTCFLHNEHESPPVRNGKDSSTYLSKYNYNRAIQNFLSNK